MMTISDPPDQISLETPQAADAVFPKQKCHTFITPGETEPMQVRLQSAFSWSEWSQRSGMSPVTAIGVAWAILLRSFTSSETVHFGHMIATRDEESKNLHPIDRKAWEFDLEENACLQDVLAAAQMGSLRKEWPELGPCQTSLACSELPFDTILFEVRQAKPVEVEGVNDQTIALRSRQIVSKEPFKYPALELCSNKGLLSR